MVQNGSFWDPFLDPLFTGPGQKGSDLPPDMSDFGVRTGPGVLKKGSKMTLF